MTAEPAAMAMDQRHRWSTVLTHLAGAVPSGAPSVVVDGADGSAALLADRLAGALQRAGRLCVRLSPATCSTHPDARHGRASDTVVIADGPRWRAQLPAEPRQVTIWVRCGNSRYRGDDADIVIDLHDPAWPVIRHIDRWLASTETWYRAETQAFFAKRAATWDTRFGDDLPAYAAAVSEAGIASGGTVVDVGCGTGRALPALRDAVGPDGAVIGIDLTPQMLAAARGRATVSRALLVQADARHLPLATATADAVFAAGLLTYLPDTEPGLRELARVTRPGGRLVLFHPSGRAALAARHGRTLHPDEPLAERPLGDTAHRTGWHLTWYDDAPHRFLAIATRQPLHG